MSDIDGIRRRARFWFAGASLFSSLMSIGCLVFIYFENAGSTNSLLNVHGTALWYNAAALALFGSFLYFARKSYVYLITDKIDRIRRELAELYQNNEAEIMSALQSRLTGYCVYLFSRPFAGVIIGPLIMMIALGGLSTIGRAEFSAGALSEAGSYLALTLSFLGGYKASDMFDYFSKMGAHFIATTGDSA